jgi:hypothetical protein
MNWFFKVGIMCGFSFALIFEEIISSIIATAG